jgi:hypothetical protein
LTGARARAGGGGRLNRGSPAIRPGATYRGRDGSRRQVESIGRRLGPPEVRWVSQDKLTRHGLPVRGRCSPATFARWAVAEVVDKGAN